MGQRVVKDIDVAGYEGRSAANAGRVLGMVATALLVLVLLVSLLGGHPLTDAHLSPSQSRA